MENSCCVFDLLEFVKKTLTSMLEDIFNIIYVVAVFMYFVVFVLISRITKNRIR